MKNTHKEPFDKEAVYDAEINPLMAQIIDICKREGISMLASIKYAENSVCVSSVFSDWAHSTKRTMKPVTNAQP